MSLKSIFCKQKLQLKRDTVIPTGRRINTAEEKTTLKTKISGQLTIETVMTGRLCPGMIMVRLGALKNKGLMMTSINKSTRMIMRGIEGSKMTSVWMSA